MKSWLQNNDMYMYSTHNEEKSLVAGSFTRTLMNKSYKYLTLISKNLYIDKLNNIVNEYNNKYNITIKMESVDVKSSTYFGFNEKSNDEDPNFEVDDHVRILNIKIFLQKCTFQIGLKKFL